MSELALELEDSLDCSESFAAPRIEASVEFEIQTVLCDVCAPVGYVANWNRPSVRVLSEGLRDGGGRV